MSSRNKLTAMGKRKLGLEAPIIRELTRPPLEVDVAEEVDQLLELLTEEEFSSLCKLILMPFHLIIPLIQVMNNPEVKDSIAHLPIWKQVQFGFRQFCPVKTKWSRKDIRVWGSMPSSNLQRTSEENAVMERLSTRHRVWALSWGWHTWYWDKGVKDGLWFIKNSTINQIFLDLREIRDPEEENDISTNEKETSNVIFYNSARDLYRAVAFYDEVLNGQEVQNLSKVEQLYYWGGLGRSRTGMRDFMTRQFSCANIPNPFESEYWLKRMQADAEREADAGLKSAG